MLKQFSSLFMIGLVFFLSIFKKANAQKFILKENFESKYLYDTTKFYHKGDSVFSTRVSGLDGTPKVYGINTYTPKQKSPITINTSSRDSQDDGAYLKNSCLPDYSNESHGFYASILLYDKVMPSARDLMVIKLDSAMQKGKTYSIGFDAVYHMFTKYRIDSLQVLFVQQEKDIQLFLAERSYKGMIVGFSLTGADNQHWQTMNDRFTSDGNYGYMVIGNLKTDDETVIKKVNNGNCGNKEKAFWGYGELFLDNIFIVEK